MLKTLKFNIKKNALPTEFAPWLVYAGSFVEKVRAVHAIDEINVTVLSQEFFFPKSPEKALLKMKRGEAALMREVFIHSPQKNWMFARTVIPESYLTGEERKLAELGEKSLGSVLFRYQDLKRSPFEFSHAYLKNEWQKNLPHAIHDKVWTRRSLFYFNAKSLLLTEFFLPDVFVTVF